MRLDYHISYIYVVVYWDEFDALKTFIVEHIVRDSFQPNFMQTELYVFRLVTHPLVCNEACRKKNFFLKSCNYIL